MRKLLLASVAAAALSAPAFAADLPSRTVAPSFVAPAPIAYSWTGFYAGLDAGYGWADNSWRSTGAPAFTNFRTDGDGFVGGGHAGFNWQINQFVIGFEGMINWADVNGSGLCAGAAGSNCRARQDWIGDLNARAGFAIDRALIYATGGVAFTDFRFDNPPAGQSWGTSSRTGWTIGAGIDYAITNNWIAGIQYKYYDFGSSTIGSTPAGTTVNFKNTENVILARISYKFGGPAAPVVAKY
jgi:outer membrane immunogenic protein